MEWVQKAIILIVYIVVLSLPVAYGDTIYVLCPLRNESPDREYHWIGSGIVMKLQEYLSQTEDAKILPFSQVVAESPDSKPSGFNDREALRLVQQSGSNSFLWGQYSVKGRILECEIYVIQDGILPKSTFQVQGRLDQFNVLVQRIMDKLFHLKGKSIPIKFRRQWRVEEPLDETYRYYIQAFSPGCPMWKRREFMNSYLEIHPNDLPANLFVAEWVHEGTPEEAVRIYRKILERTPGCGLAESNLGFLLAAESKRNESEKCYEAALKCEDQYPETYFNYGNLFRKLSRLDSAIRIYEQGIRKFPKTSFLYYNLALSYDQKGFADLRAEAYRKASDLDKTLRSDFFENRFFLNDRWISLKGEEMP